MAGKKTTILAVDDDHLLQVTISRLGSKLEPDPTPPRYLLTKAGIGYMLVAPANLQAGR